MKTQSLKTIPLAILLAALLVSACSHKNVNMSKHRKSRKCNCPSFTENNDSTTPSSAIHYDTRGTV